LDENCKSVKKDEGGQEVEEQGDDLMKIVSKRSSGVTK
jgi:hypothetical protein